MDTPRQSWNLGENFYIEPEREEDTTRHNFTIKERFSNGLSLYYAHRRQDEDVSSSLTEISPDEFTVNTVGADYINKGLFLQAEYSDEDSTQIPSTSKMLQGRYSWPVNKDTRASLRVSNHWLDFDEPDNRDVELFKSGAEIFSRLTDEYSLSARADYRDEDDKDGVNQSAMSALMTGNWGTMPDYYFYREDFGVGCRYDVSSNWIIKAEWHQIEGADLLTSYFNDTFGAAPVTEKDWDYYIVKTSFNF